MGLSRASDCLRRAWISMAVHDWNQGIRTFVPDYNVLDDPDFSRKAFEASRWRASTPGKSPVLLIHGDDDRNVSFIRFDQPDHGAAQAQRRSRAVRVPRRSARLPASRELGARL
jgi:hypothetical protein